MSGIDVHTHLAPAPDSDHGPRLGPAALYQPDRLEAYLDSTGLTEAIVTVPPPFYRQEQPGGAAAAWVHAVNEGLLAAVAGRARLTPLAYLPLEHPSVTLAEYERIRADSRWAGVVAAAGARSVPLDSDALSTLWSRLDADGRTVQLHPGHSPDTRLEPYYLANLLGNPVETAIAASQLVFGGVLSAFPGIRFILVHGGGCLPAVVGRWERGYVTARPGVPSLALSPAAAVRHLYVDALTHDPAVTDVAVTVFGPDRILLGSDWPFPMGTIDPVAAVVHRGEKFARRVATANAAAALGRPGGQPAGRPGSSQGPARG